MPINYLGPRAGSGGPLPDLTALDANHLIAVDPEGNLFSAPLEVLPRTTNSQVPTVETTGSIKTGPGTVDIGDLLISNAQGTLSTQLPDDRLAFFAGQVLGNNNVTYLKADPTEGSSDFNTVHNEVINLPFTQDASTTGDFYTVDFAFRPAMSGELVAKVWILDAQGDPLRLIYNQTRNVTGDEVSSGNEIRFGLVNPYALTQGIPVRIELTGIDLYGGTATSGPLTGTTTPFYRSIVHSFTLTELQDNLGTPTRNGQVPTFDTEGNVTFVDLPRVVNTPTTLPFRFHMDQNIDETNILAALSAPLYYTAARDKTDASLNLNVVGLTMDENGDNLSYPLEFTIGHIAGTQRFTDNNTFDLFVRNQSGQIIEMRMDGQVQTQPFTVFQGDLFILRIDSADATSVTLVRTSSADPRGLVQFDLSDTEVDFSSLTAFTNSFSADVPSKGEQFRVTTGGSALPGTLLNRGDVIVSLVNTPRYNNADDWAVYRRITSFPINETEHGFLSQIQTVTVDETTDYAESSEEIRIKLYDSTGAYTAADLGSTGQVDQYTEVAERTGVYAFVRIPLTSTDINFLGVRDELWLYGTREDGIEYPIANFHSMTATMQLVATVGSSTDWRTTMPFDYHPRDVLTLRTRNRTTRYTIFNMDIATSIPDGSITRQKLSTAVQTELGRIGQGPSNAGSLPAALTAFVQGARVNHRTEGGYESNNQFFGARSTGEWLKNGMTGLRLPLANANLENEIPNSEMSAVASDARFIYIDTTFAGRRDNGLDISTRGVLTGVGINGGRAHITNTDSDNPLIMVAAKFCQIGLGEDPLLQVKQRGSNNFVNLLEFTRLDDTLGQVQHLGAKVQRSPGSTETVTRNRYVYSTSGRITNTFSGVNTSGEFLYPIYAAHTFSITFDLQINGNDEGPGNSPTTFTVDNLGTAKSTTFTGSWTVNGHVHTQDFTIQYVPNTTRYGGPGHTLRIIVDSLADNANLDIDHILVTVTYPETETITHPQDFTDRALHVGSHDRLGLSHNQLDTYKYYAIAVFLRPLSDTDNSLAMNYAVIGYDDNQQLTVYTEEAVNFHYGLGTLDFSEIRFGSTQTCFQDLMFARYNAGTPVANLPNSDEMRDRMLHHFSKEHDHILGYVSDESHEVEEVVFPETIILPNQRFLGGASGDKQFSLSLDDIGRPTFTEVE